MIRYSLLPYLRTPALLAAVLLATSCAPEPSDDAIIAPSAGELDLSNYVAVGTSLTAGYGDNALYRSGQEASFPAILGRQLAVAGGGPVDQPLLAATTNTLAQGVGFGPDGGRAFIQSITNGLPQVVTTAPTQYGPVPAAVLGFLADRAGVPAPTTINNWGVPGIRIPDVVTPGFGSAANLAGGTANPFFVRMLGPAGSNATVLESAEAVNPTFLTIELGANDVLGYVVSGGDGQVLALATEGYLTLARNSYSTIIDTLLTGANSNREAVIFTVPNPLLVPYVTTAGPSVTSAVPAAALNLPIFYIQNNGVTSDTVETTLGAFANPYAPNQPAVLLPYLQQFGAAAASAAAQGRTRDEPLPDAWVLDPTEKATVVQLLTAYNTHINAEAAALGDRVVVFDVGAWQQQLVFTGTPVTIDGYTGYDNRYVLGGIYALDGVHLTPRGYAFAANAVIDLLNNQFGARIPKADPLAYQGTLFPN